VFVVVSYVVILSLIFSQIRAAETRITTSLIYIFILFHQTGSDGHTYRDIHYTYRTPVSCFRIV